MVLSSNIEAGPEFSPIATATIQQGCLALFTKVCETWECYICLCGPALPRIYSALVTFGSVLLLLTGSGSLMEAVSRHTKTLVPEATSENGLAQPLQTTGNMLHSRAIFGGSGGSQKHFMMRRFQFLEFPSSS